MARKHRNAKSPGRRRRSNTPPCYACDEEGWNIYNGKPTCPDCFAELISGEIPALNVTLLVETKGRGRKSKITLSTVIRTF